MILFFDPVYKEKIWGAEYWGISAHPNGMSLIKNGEYKGKTLSYLWDNNREIFNNLQKDKFPLLVKIIDAKDDLSVQVHPSDEYAYENENKELGKTECWYILDAKEDADIIYGVNAKDKKELENMIDNKNWDELLNTIPIEKGDFLYIPSGTVHAIKSGTKILEIQQNSDTTYRLYDYDRKDDKGNLRQLHIEKSKDVINCESPEIKKEYQSIIKDNNKKTILVESEFFSVYKYEVKEEILMENKKPFKIINILKGSGEIITKDERCEVKEDDFILITGDTKEYNIKGNVEFLLSTI